MTPLGNLPLLNIQLLFSQFGSFRWLFDKQLKEQVFMLVSSYDVGFPSPAILLLCQLSEAQFW